MLIHPLNLEADAMIQAALDDPEQLDVSTFWQQLSEDLVKYPPADQLWIAGWAIAQVADVLARRSDQWLTDWEMMHLTPNVDPILSADDLTGLLRQTMQLSLDGLLETPIRAPRRPGDMMTSVAEVVDKQTVLAMMESQDWDSHVEMEPAQRSPIAHDEDVLAWHRAIAHWFSQQSPTCVISLPQLAQAISMPLIQVWLVVLTGNYRLQQRGSFYDANAIWVQWLSPS